MHIAYTDMEFLAQREVLNAETKKRSDRWMDFLLAFYFVIGLLLSGYYGTWNIALMVGCISIVAYYSAKFVLPESDIYQYVLSAVLGIFMAQFIYQMHGMAEMHFFAFIGSALLITYQKWKLQIPIFLVVLLHHATFGYLQNIGVKQVYFRNDLFDLQVFAIHIFLTVFIFFVCGLWAYQLKRNAENQIIQHIQLMRLQKFSVINEERQRAQDALKRYNKHLIHSNQALKFSREAAQKAKYEAEQANKAKSIFLATISHEIRTPLNGMIGIAYLLAETPLIEQQRLFVNSITNCSESLLSVINDIIDLSKIEAGSIEIEQKEFNMHNCIEEVVDMFSAKAAQKGIELTYDIDNDMPNQVIGDKGHLQQVLINLTGNALKFTPQGEVCIKADVLMHNIHGNLELKFAVYDTGIGIPADKVRCLFKAFSQVDSAHNRKYAGAGLGLAICERLVKLMNGNIRVKSEPEVGSVFTFTILAEAGANKVEKQKENNMFEHVGKQVLIVDDNQTNRIILKAQIENWGLEPIIAASGEDALMRLADDPLPDMIITDAQMPGMSGIQFATVVKEQYPNIPIMLLSSIGDEYGPENIGLFTSILSKPVKQYQLGKHLLNALENASRPATSENKVRSLLLPSFAKRHPMEILVADDNKINVLLVVQLLRKLGYEPAVAENGRQAVDYTAKKHFDVVLMDIQMPEMDGLEATKIIRKRNGTQPIVIALTANALHDCEEYIADFMDDYMQKPLQIEILIGLLEKWSPVNRPKRTVV
ncbi:response regulator [Mucilaginibacter agri]|uniref:Sensory/regulatory protein RpfC n=1 Tax=Mucilaginibacter agri TaxID=2695265 RepID=A0A965ZFD0_9SPHI|nr:response regulator [Mucilaginibacter agri]NCD68731.1 response regulator [Mucilaginibacter agri]